LTDGFGEPVTIAAALASAAPIILKFKEILKQAGITDEQIAMATSKATAAFNKETGQNIKKVIFKAELGIQGSKSKISPDDLGEPTTAEAERVVNQALVNSTGLTAVSLENAQGGSNKIMDYIKKNPVIAVAGAFLIYKVVKN
jgi:hypothetical protein